VTEPLNFLDRGAHPWQERLAYVVDMMRELSTFTEPHALVATYSARMRALRMGRMLSLSRRGVTPPRFVLARDSAWANQPNPWRARGELPVMEGGLLGELVYSNEVTVIDDLRVAAGDPAAELLAGYRSLLAIPVFDGGEAKNVVVFLREGVGAFDREEVPQHVFLSNLFGRLTHNLVLSDEVKRAYEMLDRELRTIAEIQRSLLPPELPEIPTLDLAAYYRPAARAGGDYYDFLPLRDGTWAVLIADVSGHGSPAAVEMAITRTLAHVRAEGETSAGPLLEFLNEHLAERVALARGTFVTAFAGIYAPATRTLRYASAGHHPPLVRRCGDGSHFSLDGSRAPPLGLVRGQAFEEADARFLPGDRVVLYTDGIPEAFGPDNAMFGMERFEGALGDCGASARELVDSVLGALEAFTGDREPADDITLLCARVT